MKDLTLVDRFGGELTARRVAGELEILISDSEGASAFYATATHVGKLLEFVVDMFFPKGAQGDEPTKDS